MTVTKNSPRAGWRGGLSVQRCTQLWIRSPDCTSVARDTAWCGAKGLSGRRADRGDAVPLWSRRPGSSRRRCALQSCPDPGGGTASRTFRCTGRGAETSLFCGIKRERTPRAATRPVTWTDVPAPSVSRSMADKAPIRLLLLDGPMANGGRMKPAFRTFFPAATRLLAHDTSCPKKCASPVLRCAAALRVHAAPARHGRSRVSRAMGAPRQPIGD